MTDVFVQREDRDTQEEDGHMTTEAEIGELRL